MVIRSRPSFSNAWDSQHSHECYSYSNRPHCSLQSAGDSYILQYRFEAK